MWSNIWEMNPVEDSDIWKEKPFFLLVGKYLFSLRPLCLDDLFDFRIKMLYLFTQWEDVFRTVKFFDFDEMNKQPKDTQEKFHLSFINGVMGNESIREFILELFCQYFLDVKKWKPKFWLTKIDFRLRKLFAEIYNNWKIKKAKYDLGGIMTADEFAKIFFWAYHFNEEGLKKNIQFRMEAHRMAVSPDFLVFLQRNSDGVKWLSERQVTLN